MTLVLARKFGERIIVVSDTMISHRHAARQDIIPGTLKSLVVHRYASIAYAGSVATALDVIAEAKESLARGSNLKSVLEFIRFSSKKRKYMEQACDFIITSHISGATMYRVVNGELFGPLDRCWIGNPAPLPEIDQIEASLLPDAGDRGYVSAEESRFTNAALDLAFEPAARQPESEAFCSTS